MTPTMIHNANKVGYLVKQYPEHDMNQIIGLFVLPPIDINAAVWAAIELGFISEPDPDEHAVRLLKEPESWDFGQDVNDLIDTIYYCMEKLNSKENDMEDNYLSNWTMGYQAHDILVAMKRLLENKQLATYELEDGENAYDFYTLYDNREQLWGRKQFKKDPLAQRKNKKKE